MMLNHDTATHTNATQH